MTGQERGLFLQDLGEDLEVRLTVLVGKLSCCQFHLRRHGLEWSKTDSCPPCCPPIPQKWVTPALRRGSNSPERYPGSTRQPGCHSLALWGPGGQCAQAVGKRWGKSRQGKGRMDPCGWSRLTAQATRAPTYCHVGSAASATCFGLGVDKAATDAEVTELDLAPLIQQDVGGFDVPVDHTMLLLQVVECLHNLRGKRSTVTGGGEMGLGLLPQPGHSPLPSSCPGSAQGWDPASASSVSQHRCP